MPIKIMKCPKCKHTYNLPTETALKDGFKRCPACGHKKGCKYRRWNFEATDDTVTVCYGDHDKGQPCEYEELSPHEVVEILNDMRSELLRRQPHLL